MDHDKLVASLKKASPELLNEIKLEAEARLDAQLSTAIASDQRAMTFLGFLLTLVAFLIGASLAAITAATPSPTIANIAAAGAIGLGLSGVLAYLASRPIDFRFVGNDPESWTGDIDNNISLHDALAEQTAYYDKMLKANRRAMKIGAELLRWASIVAGVTVLVCGVLSGWFVIWAPVANPT